MCRFVDEFSLSLFLLPFSCIFHFFLYISLFLPFSLLPFFFPVFLLSENKGQLVTMDDADLKLTVDRRTNSKGRQATTRAPPISCQNYPARPWYHS